MSGGLSPPEGPPCFCEFCGTAGLVFTTGLMRATSEADAALVDGTVRSVLIAVIRKMRSPQMTGDALPRPGTSTFHLTFLVSLHSDGGLPSGATPVPSGPRNWCQFFVRSLENSSANST